MVVWICWYCWEQHSASGQDFLVPVVLGDGSLWSEGPMSSLCGQLCFEEVFGPAKHNSMQCHGG